MTPYHQNVSVRYASDNGQCPK